jgi:hypothetical protein
MKFLDAEQENLACKAAKGEKIFAPLREPFLVLACPG